MIVSRAFQFAVILLAAASASAANWPQFRGPGGLGLGEGFEPPVYFGPQSNVVWKLDLPAGNSSPVIWSNKLFVTAHDKSTLETIGIDRSNGRVIWRKPAPASKAEEAHRLSGPATSTAVTDGDRVFVYFGSFGLLAYDFEGKEQWQMPLATPVVEFGTGTSPILIGDLLILVCDQDEGSFMLALNKQTGKVAWRVERPEFRRGFATPFFWRHEGVEELVVPGSVWLTSYSPKNGKELWRYAGTSRVATASPVADDQMLFNASWNIGGDEGARMTMEPFDEFARLHDSNKDGKLARDEIPGGAAKDRFGQTDLNKDGVVTAAEWQNMREMFDRAENGVIGLRSGGKGDITRSHLAWKSLRSLPYCSSPLLFRDRLYTIKNGGLFSCYEAHTGKVICQDERLGAGGDYYSSAVAVGEKIFIASQQGVVVVVAPGNELNVLARNALGEQVMATPAIVDGKLYVRTATKLFAFGER